MIGTAVKEGSPGDDHIRFVFQVAFDETSCIAGKRRAFDGPNKDKSEQGATRGSRWTGASSRIKVGF